MLDGGVVEIFEKYSVFPSLLKLRNLISSLHCDFVFTNSLWNTEFFKGVWLHEKGESVPWDFFASDFTVSNHTMWSGLKITSTNDLSDLTQLEGTHVGWDWNFGHFSKPVFGIKPSISWACYWNLLSFSINVHSWSKSGQCTMIIVPSTPISLSGSFLREGEVMKHSSNMLLSFLNDSGEMILLIVFNFLFSSSINLLSK